jgi:hypothetical protein
MFAEAIDTGAFKSWMMRDQGWPHYLQHGVGRVDNYHHAEGRSSTQVESEFRQLVGQYEYSEIYIVARNFSWRH